MSFGNYKLQNTCLCKSLKHHLSVQPRTVNTLKCPKDCCNIDHSSFITFVHHSVKIYVAQTLS